MAKSMRSKMKKRLRAIRREMVEPFYDNKDAAKLAAQEAALAAPKLVVTPSPKATEGMEVVSTSNMATTSANTTDVEMADLNQSVGSLKPIGGIGKKARQFKVGKRHRHGKGNKGKGKVKRRHI